MHKFNLANESDPDIVQMDSVGGIILVNNSFVIRGSCFGDSNPSYLMDGEYMKVVSCIRIVWWLICQPF